MSVLAAAGVMSDPATFAHHLSGGRYQILRHNRLIADTVADMCFANKGGILVIEAPPRHSKSETISHWLPVWALTLWPRDENILASYEAEFAAHWGRRVRNTITETGCIELATDSQAAHRFHTRLGGALHTAGVGGAITGRTANRLFIIDDPVKNAEEADSETMSNKLWDWFLTVAYTRREPTTLFVVMATRWGERDLIGRILEHPELSKQVTRLRFPALAEENDALGRQVGEALWPEKFSREYLLQTEASMSARYWASLFQQRPSAAEGAEVKRHWWRFYDELPVTTAQMDQILVSWDAAFKGAETSDFVVGQAWGCYGSYRYLLDQVRGRMDFVETLQAVRAFNEKWRPTVTLVEDKANGSAIMSALAGVVPALIPVNPMGSKEARLRAVAPQIQAAEVFLPRTARFSDELVEECAAFPFGKNDDMADAMSQALEYARHMRSVPRHDFTPSDDRFVAPRIEKERHRLQGLIPQFKFG